MVKNSYVILSVVFSAAACLGFVRAEVPEQPAVPTSKTALIRKALIRVIPFFIVLPFPSRYFRQLPEDCFR